MTITTALLLLLAIIVSAEVIRLLFLGLMTKQLGNKATPASRVASEETSKILVVGDSLAYGTGASTPEHSLVGRLATDFKNFAIENHSENGASIKEVVQQLAEVGDQAFTVVVIFVGGIDTVSFTKMNKVETQLRELYRQANRVSTDEVIHVSVNNTGLIPMFRFPLSLLFSSRSCKISQLSQALAKKHSVINIPLYADKVNDPLDGNPEYYAADKIHPNDRGYEIWYKEIAQVIRPQLEKINLKPH